MLGPPPGPGGSHLPGEIGGQGETTRGSHEHNHAVAQKIYIIKKIPAKLPAHHYNYIDHMH